jgi:hypothetical protein
MVAGGKWTILPITLSSPRVEHSAFLYGSSIIWGIGRSSTSQSSVDIMNVYTYNITSYVDTTRVGGSGGVSAIQFKDLVTTSSQQSTNIWLTRAAACCGL